MIVIMTIATIPCVLGRYACAAMASRAQARAVVTHREAAAHVRLAPSALLK
jgi:hypothetical protein